jgi:hypothetical protein
VQHIPADRRQERDPVDAGVPTEPLVLGAKDRRDERGRNLRERNPRQAPAAEIGADLLKDLAVAVEEKPLGGEIRIPNRLERRKDSRRGEERTRGKEV